MSSRSTEKNNPVGTSAPVVTNNATSTAQTVHVETKSSSAQQAFVVAKDKFELVVDRSVLAKIVGLAVREVPGVHALAAFGTGERIVHFAERLTGQESYDTGVHVEIGKIECAADLRIICEYGVDISKVGTLIHEKVERRIKEMTGLQLRALSIEVVDLFFNDDASDIRPGRELR